MKKLLLSFVIIVLAVSSITAAMVGTVDPYSRRDVFSSPALLLDMPESPPFGFQVTARSAVDYLSYLASPSDELSESADYLFSYLMDEDLKYWQENFETIKNIYAFDKVFSSYSEPASDAELLQLKANFESLYNSVYSKGNKAQSVINAVSSTDIFKSSKATDLYSDAILSVYLEGGKVYDNGFGWKLESNIGFTGAEEMLGNTEGNLLNFDVRGKVGYAIHLFSENFTIGGALETSAIFNNNIDGASLLVSRFTANPVNAFGNNFNLGLGLALNFGSMYRLNEELAFMLDLRNVVNFRSYSILAPTDFVAFDGFDKDENIYYVPVDAALSALWDKGPYHLEVEFSDVVNQMILLGAKQVDKFDFYRIPKVYFNYDLSDKLTLTSSLRDLYLGVGIEYDGLKASVYTALDKLGFGVSVGYSL